MFSPGPLAILLRIQSTHLQRWQKSAMWKKQKRVQKKGKKSWTKWMQQEVLTQRVLKCSQRKEGSPL